MEFLFMSRHLNKGAEEDCEESDEDPKKSLPSVTHQTLT